MPEFKYYTYIAAFFVAGIMISNTVATKLFSFYGFVFTGGVLIFPITYIFGDILTEVYGYSRSRKIIWAGFAALVLMSLIYLAVGYLPAAPGWSNQAAYDSILGLVPRIVLASMIGYFAGEFANSYILAKLKIRTKGRHLWLRTISSTVVGEGVDTALFVFIAFYNTIPGSILIIAMLSSYLFKVLYEIIATPVTYKVVRFLKKQEGADHYDTRTNFSPFTLS